MTCWVTRSWYVRALHTFATECNAWFTNFVIAPGTKVNGMLSYIRGMYTVSTYIRDETPDLPTLSSHSTKGEWHAELHSRWNVTPDFSQVRSILSSPQIVENNVVTSIITKDNHNFMVLCCVPPDVHLRLIAEQANTRRDFSLESNAACTVFDMHMYVNASFTKQRVRPDCGHTKGQIFPDSTSLQCMHSFRQMLNVSLNGL